MMFNLYVVVLCISFVGTNSEYIPVLLWQPDEANGKVAGSPPSLAKVSVEQFSDYFSKKIGERKHIVVFLEENLSMEDFGGLNLDDTFSSLKNITSSSHVNFLPSVQSPYKALKTLGLKMKAVNVKDFDYTFPKAEKSILVFKLGDARSEEDRPDFLKRHDNIIGEVYNSLVNKYDDVLAVYTAHHSSWIEPYLKPNVRRVRQLLETSSELETNGSFWNRNNTLVYTKRPPVFRHGTDEINITDVISITTSTIAGNVMLSVRIKSLSSVSMRLTFSKSSGYWSFDKIEVKNDTQNYTLLPSAPITAPLHFSYHCSSNVIFTSKDNDASVTFYGLQVEPYVSSNDTFNDAYDCVPFFSAPIWSGIFITVLLAIVMIWALTMIMDIKTMDQFDNPKGKTITINATD
ncbi:V-type proton ATPase subunit S1-like [Schistocerca nitens]|uniref:V-type proton ATPase subunit S1-like n=1 Tax=Schistocerca nitens TaxID=7011 RepID=UPI0021180102|nr:V-type proton ATPase subunit S1-like [Schistocerca nitens]